MWLYYLWPWKQQGLLWGEFKVTSYSVSNRQSEFHFLYTLNVEESVFRQCQSINGWHRFWPNIWISIFFNGNVIVFMMQAFILLQVIMPFNKSTHCPGRIVTATGQLSHHLFQVNRVLQLVYNSLQYVATNYIVQIGRYYLAVYI